MKIKSHDINIGVRLVLLVATIFGMSWSIFLGNILTPIFLAFAILIQIASLFYSMTKTNRDLFLFLNSIKFSDFTNSIEIKHLGSAQKELAGMFKIVIAEFQKVHKTLKTENDFLTKIIEQAGIAILVIQENDKILFANQAARKLLNVSNIESLNNVNQNGGSIIDQIKEIKAGERKIVENQHIDSVLQLAFYASNLHIDSNVLKTVSIKNIQPELEEKEMQAWQKLIEVMTHQIMNSLAPIVSLAATTNDIVKDIIKQDSTNDSFSIDSETVFDIANSLDTIHNRSNGLIDFVKIYRAVTNITQPVFDQFPIKTIINEIVKEKLEELNSYSIDLQVNINPENLLLNADKKHIKTVLTNIITNAIDAVKHRTDGKIEISAFVNYLEHTTIKITDNGQGILQEVKDNIFVPFFTTKPNNSGIGLSMAKQIMRLHAGTITVDSDPDKLTCFTLNF